VGGNAGYFSLQMELRGASRCVLVEPIAEYAEQARFAFSQFDARVTEDVHTYCLPRRIASTTSSSSASSTTLDIPCSSSIVWPR
jgi:hypothetical protein